MTTLHYISPHYTTSHHTTLHLTILHYISPHYPFPSIQYPTLHYATSLFTSTHHTSPNDHSLTTLPSTNREEYDFGLNHEVCAVQLIKDLLNVTPEEMSRVVLACKYYYSLVLYPFLLFYLVTFSFLSDYLYLIIPYLLISFLSSNFLHTSTLSLLISFLLIAPLSFLLSSIVIDVSFFNRFYSLLTFYLPLFYSILIEFR